MGVWLYTEFSIGGKVARKQIEEISGFYDGLEHDGIEEAIEAQTYLTFSGEVSSGDTSALEKYCITHGIPFHIWSEREGADWGGFITYWRPDMDKPAEVGGDGSEPIATLEGLRRAEREGRSLRDVIAGLDRAEVKHLPPLELLEEEIV